MTSDHVIRNRRHWDLISDDYEAPGARSWDKDEPKWGIWGIPESQVGMLREIESKDVIELGCGTAYVSSWIARRNSKPIGIDNSRRQLDNARRFQLHHQLFFPLVHGNAESLPFKDETFDLAISEYGASIWCDPYLWIPEAARVLRPGGELRFLINGVILMLCVPDEEEGEADATLIRSYFGMHRFEWPDNSSVEFHLEHGEWIRLLRANGFEVLELLELRPDEGSTTRYPFVDLDWARKWPTEEVWKVRKTR
jgi:SAM-dependent methyltransferase